MLSCKIKTGFFLSLSILRDKKTIKDKEKPKL
jgi:hypothetical protein